MDSFAQSTVASSTLGSSPLETVGSVCTQTRPIQDRTYTLKDLFARLTYLTKFDIGCLLEKSTFDVSSMYTVVAAVQRIGEQGDHLSLHH